MEPNSLDSFQLEGPAPTSDTSYKFVAMHPDLQCIEKSIPVDEFRANMKQRDFNIEFGLLRRLTENQFQVKRLMTYHPEINGHNRYKTIIPFKDTVVELPCKNVQEKTVADSYINANYIATSRKNDLKAFIATQGPLENSKGNFWRMVWSNNVSVIIMLCNFKENGKAQCDKYWADKDGDKVMKMDGLQLELIEDNHQGKEVFVRKFRLESIDPQESRIITHFQWLRWPDHDIPKEEDFESIENLLTIMHQEKEIHASTPIIVHCSAGVGRTGTLLSIYNLDLILRENLKKKGDEKKVRVSVFGVVRRLREQRWGMVNTSNQYALIYKFISKKIENYLKTLS